MSIEVVSTTDAVEPAKAGTAAQSKETKSAPVADEAAEQNEALESDTEETEAKEDESDESDELEAKADDEAEDSEKDKAKKKSGSQRRKERAERAEAERDYWKDMALKGAGESKPAKVEAPAQSEPEGEPNPDDYPTSRAYVKAVTRWEIKQDKEAQEREQNQAKLVSDQQKCVDAHSERLTSFKEKVADWDDVCSEVHGVKTSAAFDEFILTSDQGPALMYELAKDRAELERICSLAPFAAARELGRLEYKISSQASDDEKPEPQKLTKAPAPITPVGSKGGRVQKSLNDPNLSQREYEAIRREQIKARNAS